jgi:hypothetical protein
LQENGLGDESWDHFLHHEKKDVLKSA